MAEYRKVLNDTEVLFTEVLKDTAIPQWVEFELLADDNIKEVCIIRKQNDLTEYLANGINFAVIINEDVFDELEEELQKKVFEEKLCGIEITDNDKIKYLKEDFTTFSDFLEKHGADDVILMKLSIQSLFDQKKEKELKERAEKKANKKN